MDEKNIRARLVRLFNAARQRGERVTAIHLSTKEEEELATMGVEDLGTVMLEKVREKGIRGALESGTLFGRRVIWDAPEFKVETESA